MPTTLGEYAIGGHLAINKKLEVPGTFKVDPANFENEAPVNFYTTPVAMNSEGMIRTFGVEARGGHLNSTGDCKVAGIYNCQNFEGFSGPVILTNITGFVVTGGIITALIGTS